MSDDTVQLNDEASAVVPERAAGGGAGAGRSFVGHAKLISFLTLISRFLGMARETIAAHFFGAGQVWSAFTVAFTIPNLFRKLFGEGALSAAFIPLYVNALKKEDEKNAADFAVASVNLLVTILVVLTVIGEAALWVTTLAWDLRPDRLLMVKLTAIMLPYVILICGTAFLGGILQAHHRFGPPAAAPVVLNICHIAVILIGAWILHLSTRARLESPELIARQTTLAYWLSFFVLVAGVLQVMMLAPGLRAVGFRFRWVRHFWTPAVRRMLRLSVPVALGAGVLQLSVLLDRGISFLLSESYDASTHELIRQFNLFGHWFRYPMQEGAPARLGWAQFLYQFPLGVFATALATAIFPGLSSHALDPDRTRFRQVMRQGIELAMLESLPASIGLIIVRYPAIRLLFEHGRFGPEDTALVAHSLIFYSAAIWAFSLQQILSRAYYAMHDTMTPLVLSVVTLIVNLAVELPLIWHRDLREAGMAAGTCASFILQSLVMLWILDRRMGGLGLRQSVGPVLKMLLATAAMWAACAGVQHVPHYPRGVGRLDSAAQLTILMIVGGGVYFGCCLAMGVRGVEQLLPRRWRKKAA